MGIRLAFPGGRFCQFGCRLAVPGARLPLPGHFSLVQSNRVAFPRPRCVSRGPGELSRGAGSVNLAAGWPSLGAGCLSRAIFHLFKSIGWLSRGPGERPGGQVNVLGGFPYNRSALAE